MGLPGPPLRIPSILTWVSVSLSVMLAENIVNKYNIVNQTPGKKYLILTHHRLNKPVCLK